MLACALIMANKKLSSKAQILAILRASGTPVSGEQMAGEVGISRVSVWKAVQALQAAGYQIASGKSGYTLEHDLEDSLFPWEFGADESRFCHFAEVPSTMSEARKIAQSPAPKTTHTTLQVVTADRQTQGHGQKDRKWVTTKDSLACTLITQEHIPVATSFRLVMAAEVALVNVLRGLCGRRFFVRWPNDIWSCEGKVAGVLDEFCATGDVCTWFNLGLGLNLSEHPKISKTDCAFHSTPAATRKEVLLAFCREFKIQQKVAFSTDSSLAASWSALCFDVGKTVRLTSCKREARFEGIDGYGFALLDMGGKRLRVAPAQDSIAK